MYLAKMIKCSAFLNYIQSRWRSICPFVGSGRSLNKKVWTVLLQTLCMCPEVQHCSGSDPFTGRADDDIRTSVCTFWPLSCYRARGQGRLISLSSLKAAGACCQVYGATEELGSAHITPRHSISFTLLIHPSVHPPPPPPWLLCHRLRCVKAAFTVKYSGSF